MTEPSQNSEKASVEQNQRQWSFAERRGLLLVGLSPIIANAIGSIFNILYNQTQIEPMLSEAQHDRFNDCVMFFNLIVYPLAIAGFLVPLLYLRPTHRAILNGEPIDPARLATSQRYVVNLPWWFLAVIAVGWLSCVPVFSAALFAVPEPLSQEVVWHLVTSFLIAGLIAATHSFFAMELVIQKTLFPVFFRQASPADVPGALPLNITTRGFIWAVSAGVCPAISLVLLQVVPHAGNQLQLVSNANSNLQWFVIAVALVGILFSLVTGWMLGKEVAVPVQQLKRAAIRVADGDLDVRVNLLRADEFGPLIDRFNRMVEGLRERERLQETFGRHVGHEAAKQIMEQGDGLVGTEQVITVMFVDVRNFTVHSANHSPEEVVQALNVFFRDAVETVESHRGMVNKFLGDGFMALFGIGGAHDNHAIEALEAGKAMLCCLDAASQELAQAGWPELKIGIGINTGPAIVGSIGSPKRQEYTAIGDTVNVASRVETLTKAVGRQLLVTESTREMLPDDVPLAALPPQEVKGKGSLQVYSVDLAG